MRENVSLIINAGGHKTGSTWLQKIVQALPLPLEAEPSADLDDGPGDARLSKGEREIARLGRLAARAPDGRVRFRKCHFAPGVFTPGSFDRGGRILDETCFGFLSSPNVLVLHMTRNVRDAFVSYYFHQRALERTPGLEAFFPEYARRFFDLYTGYHRYWLITAPARMGDRLHSLSYEGLTADFSGVVEGLARFLGLGEPVDATALSRAVSLDKLRAGAQPAWMEKMKSRGGDFFRKGVVGDHVNHLSERMIEAFETWERAPEHRELRDAARRRGIDL